MLCCRRSRRTGSYVFKSFSIFGVFFTFFCFFEVFLFETEAEKHAHEPGLFPISYFLFPISYFLFLFWRRVPPLMNAIGRLVTEPPAQPTHRWLAAVLGSPLIALAIARQ